MNRITLLFNSPAPGGDSLRQEQREAILDALHYCMYADNRLVLAEGKVIEDWSTRLAWQSEVALSNYVEHSVEKVRRSKEEPAFRAELAADIHARLGDTATRELALGLCKKLIAADGFAADSEARVLDELKLDKPVL